MATSNVLSDQERMMDTLYWWGIPSLFRCPVDADPGHCDIALVGVPHSAGNGSTEHDQHLGPRAVRHISANARRMHLKFGFSPWEACRVHDLGDVPLPELNDNEASIERITEYFSHISEAGARPVAVGGDHGITGGILQALGGEGSRLTGGEKAAILHFDAHTDAYDNLPHFLGSKKNAGNWAAYLVKQGNVDAERSVQMGMRGNTRWLDYLKSSHDLGYEVITKEQHEEYGNEKCIEIFRERIGDAPLYITFDLDALDLTIAPAVANPEPFGGFTMNEAVRLLHGVRGLNIIGGDVVCLMPSKDHPNNVTSIVAAAIMFEIISLIADRIGGA